MEQFLVFASGYAIIIAATANVGYVCFNMGLAVGRSPQATASRKAVLTDDD